MNLKNYNQYENYYTRNACGIVSILNVLKYRYAIFVVPNAFIKLCIFLEKLNVWSPSKGASFGILYKTFTFYLNKKLGLKFKVVTKQISTLEKGDNDTYGIGIKGYSTRKWNKIKEDGKIDKEDIDYLLTRKGGIGHATNWDGSAGGYFIDTDGGKNTKMSLATLKYAEQKDILRDNIRTISPVDTETVMVCDYTIEMFKAEKKGKLEQYFKGKSGIYFTKAKKLYIYGR